jgi:2-methylcitrate dehydratase PrpD
LDAIRAMQARHPFGAAAVDRIVVHGSQATVDHVGWPYRPQGLTSAQLNLPFCAATLLLEGDAFVDQFTEASVADPQRMALAGRVEVRHDPAITAKGGKFRHMVRVEVHLKDGTRLDKTVEAARGSEDKFASEADVMAKFRKLVRRKLPDAQAERLIERMLALETVPDSREIVSLLTAGRA